MKEIISKDGTKISYNKTSDGAMCNSTFRHPRSLLMGVKVLKNYKVRPKQLMIECTIVKYVF